MSNSKRIWADRRKTCTNTFGLTYAILDCSEGTSLDDFGQGILVDDDQDEEIPQVYKRGRRNGDVSFIRFLVSFATTRSDIFRRRITWACIRLDHRADSRRLSTARRRRRLRM